jgi:adenosylcobyric acid synthase
MERAAQRPFEPTHINVAVVLLPRMSNFTDFKHVAEEPDVRLRYIEHPRDLAEADAVLIPGSKNTLEDWHALQLSGFPDALRRHVYAGRELIGICGGFQMLGRDLTDPDGVESGGSADGLGLLDISTVMRTVKTTSLVEARALHLDHDATEAIAGYYIHMGATERGKDRACFEVFMREGASGSGHSSNPSLDGAVSHDGLVWGTYIHGVFDHPGFRRAWLNRIRRRKGWEPLALDGSSTVSRRLDDELDRWADHVGRYLDRDRLFRSMGIDGESVRGTPPDCR